jgi:hypothetical protein
LGKIKSDQITPGVLWTPGIVVLSFSLVGFVEVDDLISEQSANEFDQRTEPQSTTDYGSIFRVPNQVDFFFTTDRNERHGDSPFKFFSSAV